MGTLEIEIAAAIGGAGSTASSDIVTRLSDMARTKLAVERFDQLRRAKRQRAKNVDQLTQLPLPGFEHLHAFYPNEAGVETKLDELTADECRMNAKRCLAEADQWDGPRLKNEGQEKRLEAEELERWARGIEEREERALRGKA
jgi:hypothetical protein